MCEHSKEVFKSQEFFLNVLQENMTWRNVFSVEGFHILEVFAFG